MTSILVFGFEGISKMYIFDKVLYRTFFCVESKKILFPIAIEGILRV